MMPSLLEGNSLFRNVYCFLAANEGNQAHCTPAGATVLKDGILPAGWEWVAFALAGFSIAMLVLNLFLVLVMFYTYMERRLLGRFQSRIGPNRAGPFGLLQPVADAIKLLTKESIIPEGTDRWLYNLAPVVMVVPVFLILAVLPFGKNSFIANINVGVLFVLAVTSVHTLAVFMAGVASGNRYAMFGGIRAVAQLISYEVPVVLSIVGVLLMAGSLSLVEIVGAQKVPFILLQPLGFFIFLAGSSAEMNRSPFDQIEAESELGAGYHTEYGGMKFALFYLAEFGAVLTTSGIITTLFLGGWEGPFLPSHVWFLLKVFLVAFGFIWIRATLPRLRIDQTMAFAWKFLLPLSLINIFVTATEVLIWGEVIDGIPMGILNYGSIWLVAAINFGIAIAAIIVFSRLVSLRSKGYEVPRHMSSAMEGN